VAAAAGTFVYRGAQEVGGTRSKRAPLTQMRHSVIGGELIAWRAGDVASRD
jgi:hypothetical protein